MTLYVPLDVDFATDSKMIAAGPVAGYLYISSLAFAKRTLSDGLIERPQLVAIAIGVPTPEKHAQRLVEVGLWVEEESGWRIVSFLKRNKSRVEVEAKKEKKRLAAVKANHTRWHSEQASDECPFCDPNRIERGLQVKPKPETKAEASTSDDRIERETRRRVAVRSQRGETIGPGLVDRIRNDVRLELAALEAADKRCASCAGRFTQGTGFLHAAGCAELRSGPETEVVGA